MQKLMSRLFIAIAPFTIAIPLQVQAADLVKLRVNVQQEKHHAVVHFTDAVIAQVGVPSGSGFNAFQGVTTDFGEMIPVFVLFKESMSDQQSMKYAEHQGKNHGKAQCELVQKGTSPDLPRMPIAVLAQNCTIISVGH